MQAGRSRAHLQVRVEIAAAGLVASRLLKAVRDWQSLSDIDRVYFERPSQTRGLFAQSLNPGFEEILQCDAGI